MQVKYIILLSRVLFLSQQHRTFCYLLLHDTNRASGDEACIGGSPLQDPSTQLLQDRTPSSPLAVRRRYVCGRRQPHRVPAVAIVHLTVVQLPAVASPLALLEPLLPLQQLHPPQPPVNEQPALDNF